MNTEESNELTKGGVRIFLVVILFSAVIAIMNLVYLRYNAWYEQSTQARESVAAKNLYELSIRDKVPVSSIISTIQQFNEGEITCLYIYDKPDISGTVVKSVYSVLPEEACWEDVNSHVNYLGGVRASDLTNTFFAEENVIANAVVRLRSNIENYCRVTFNKLDSSYIVVMIEILDDSVGDSHGI